MLTVDELARFLDEPLAPASGQFPLTRPGLAEPDCQDRPSDAEIRPFLLRFVQARPAPEVPPFRYCHNLQVAVADDDTGRPIISTTPNMEWSTITDNDGDEGPSEDFGNDYVPDHPFQP